VTVDQLLQHVHVFVVDVHWTWPFAIHEKRVFFLGSSGELFAFSGSCVSRSHAAVFLATRAVAERVNLGECLDAGNLKTVETDRMKATPAVSIANPQF
jgi:hypothetical protein